MDGGRAENGTEDEGGREWRFALSDLEPGSDQQTRDVAPGSPQVEHVLFVMLGVFATLFAIFRALFA